MRSTSIPSPNPQPKDAGLGSKAAEAFAPGHSEERTLLRAAGQATRIEPRAGAAPSSKPTYEELRQLIALYDRPAPRRRPVVHTVVIALIFIVGTAVGVGVASLLIGEQDSAMHVSSTVTRMLPMHRSGTSEGELPYDGLAADTANRQAQELSRGINAAELPYGGEASARADTRKIERMEPASLPSLLDASSESAPRVATKAETPPPSVDAVEKQVKQNVPAAPKKLAPAQARGRHSPHRSDNKDKEIQRIRQQAEQELKKKPDSRRRTAESRDPSRAATQKEKRHEGSGHGTRAPTMTAMLQQCEQAGNLISREYCKWQLCSGKWGKNGCPSYPPRGNLY